MALMEQLKQRDRRVRELEVEMGSRWNTSKDHDQYPLVTNTIPLTVVHCWLRVIFQRLLATGGLLQLWVFCSFFERVSQDGEHYGAHGEPAVTARLKEVELVQLQVNIERVRDTMG